MLKYVGLSVCLCLLALGLNRALADQGTTRLPKNKGAHSVTNGSNAPSGKPKETGWWKF
jgi:hypothetical protein